MGKQRRVRFGEGERRMAEWGGGGTYGQGTDLERLAGLQTPRNGILNDLLITRPNCMGWQLSVLHRASLLPLRLGTGLEVGMRRYGSFRCSPVTRFRSDRVSGEQSAAWIGK